MKKVFGGIAGLVFALFGVGIIALIMSLTYSGLQRIFPNNFANQMWGLVIFDIAIIAWAGAFAFKSNSLGQYVAAGAGFLVGFGGMAMMVYSEVTLSGQALVGGNVDTVEIGQWMIYAFVVGSLLHVALLWMHHAADPDLATQISTGVAQGLIRDKARVAAEHQLEVEAEYLAQAITAEAVAKARRDLHVHGQPIIDVPALPMDDSLYVPANGYPVQAPAKKAPSIFSKEYWRERFGKKQQGPREYEQAVPAPDAIADALATGQYDYCRPPHGDRNHPHLTQPDKRTIPIGVWQRILNEWDAYDEENRPISDDEKRNYAPGTHFRDGTVTPTDLNDPFWSEHPHHMGERWGTKEPTYHPMSPTPIQAGSSRPLYNEETYTNRSNPQDEADQPRAPFQSE